MSIPSSRANLSCRDAMQSRAKPLSPMAVGVLLAWIAFSDSAYALNGAVTVSGCTNCLTSTDFLTAATNLARSTVSPGTYAMIGTSYASTAYVAVTGDIVTVIRGGAPEQVLRNITATPIDASGNSLAGSSESSLESTFQQLDQMSFGTSRSGKIGFLQVPVDISPTFINIAEGMISLEGQIPALISNQYGITTGIPAGTVVTVVFQDQSKAQFYKVSAADTSQWLWNGFAWNSKNQLIDQFGNLRINPNSGGRGTGAGTVNMGAGNFGFEGDGFCVATTSVTWGGVFQGAEIHVLPC
jgi:hypothetical protein